MGRGSCYGFDLSGVDCLPDETGRQSSVSSAGENQEFTDFAVRCLRTYLFSIFCAGFQIVSTNYFQATGQPLKASLLSMLRQLLLLIPLILILPLFMGLNGILYSAPVADVASAVIVALFIIPEMRKLNNQIKKIKQGKSSFSYVVMCILIQFITDNSIKSYKRINR